MDGITWELHQIGKYTAVGMTICVRTRNGVLDGQTFIVRFEKSKQILLPETLKNEIFEAVAGVFFDL